MLEQKSLTRRLRRSCRGRFEVRLERQCWHRPLLDEARLLGIRPDTLSLVRQVYLLCDGEPWVYARTVVPLSSLRGAQRRLTKLGSRPLGDLLFANMKTYRRSIQVAKIPLDGSQCQLPACKDSMEVHAVWGRRSVFHLQGKPLLVAEFFLPALCR